MAADPPMPGEPAFAVPIARRRVISVVVVLVAILVFVFFAIFFFVIERAILLHDIGNPLHTLCLVIAAHGRAAVKQNESVR